MVHHRSAKIASLGLCAAALIAACAGGSEAPAGSTSGATGGQGGAGQGGAGGGQSGAGGDILFDGGVPEGGGGGGPGSNIIYASTDDTLYRLDPDAVNLPLVEIGKFDCIGSNAGQYKAMTDIAVDNKENLWGITGHVVMPLTIEAGGVIKCGAKTSLMSAQQGQSLPTFYALTFAPIGVIDPNVEVLMAGDSAGQLWAIDAVGNTSQHGSFGLVPGNDGNGYSYDPANVGKVWELSGDLVFLANNGSPVGFATVRDCPNPPSTTGCSKTDTLLEIDMAKLGAVGSANVAKAVRGAIVRAAGCADPVASYGSMYGIAAWNDKVYGFSRTGLLVGIDTNKGGACIVQEYPTASFSGAGVTTLAPVVVPPPK